MKATTTSYSVSTDRLYNTDDNELTQPNLCHRPLSSYKDHFFSSRRTKNPDIDSYLKPLYNGHFLLSPCKVSMFRSHALSLYVSLLPTLKNSLIVGCHACPSRGVYILSESLFLPKTHKAFRVSVITHLIFTV